GRGYEFLADFLIRLDALNPQVSAVIAKTFSPWRQMEPGRRGKARETLEKLARHTLSRNLAEIVEMMLKD
ncbi:MAG: aminopeptidase N C-terminal domain-containing protein, partial [Methylobacteriaceae bacterium]|nr:aminopeptidase N C-terminal domain-containing protein [Methylobacteriaceae bacterium]